jgi:hypothetical protein
VIGTLPVRARASSLASIIALLALAGPVEIRPPCGGSPAPAYPDPDAPPAIAGASGTSLEAWMPPSCTGWTAPGANLLVGLAASFRDPGGIDDFAARMGAVSKQRDILYWSVSDKAWRPLVTDAAAVYGPDDRRRRTDFTAAEMAPGKDLYFVEHDSRSTGEVLYRMRVLERSADRLVVNVENASPIRFLAFTLFGPEDLQAVYVVERRGPGLWGYYSLSRTGRTASRLAGGHESSYVNRAVALYRHFVGIPDDRGPPAAP